MPDFYEFPPTRSNRVKWVLEELGVAYTSQLVDFTEGQQQSDEYKVIHPLGHVPAYRTDRYTMHESVAIIMQLIDEHPDAGLAPAIGTPERAKYYQWCVFSSSELDPLLFDVMKHTMHLPRQKRVLEIALHAQKEFAARGEMLSGILENSDYLLGKSFSGADIAMGYCCNWAEYTGMIENHPVLVAYLARLQQRPAYRKVFLK